MQVKYSCNCITQMKDLLGLLRLCNKKQLTRSQSLRFLPILFSICVHASKATLQLPSFCFCTRPERKFIFQRATFSLWQTLICFVIDVPGRHTPHLLEWTQLIRPNKEESPGHSPSCRYYLPRAAYDFSEQSNLQKGRSRRHSGMLNFQFRSHLWASRFQNLPSPSWHNSTLKC